MTRAQMKVMVAVLMLAWEARAYVSNHSFVFISGWAQSGTSFVHSLFDQSNFVSSMIKSCEDRLSLARCMSWNHEGQWLISNKAIRSAIQAGKTTPASAWEGQTELSIRSDWAKYWNLSRPVLVEKSPQSVLKLLALKHAFREARQLRFLIVLKHPITLNNASPRAATWMQFRNGSAINAEQREENARHLIHFLTHNGTGNATSLGWLPAMRHLTGMLLANSVLAEQVRIVRWESFAQPIPLCFALFEFALGNQSGHDGADVCKQVFSSTDQAAVSSQDCPHARVTRQLRLRAGPEGAGTLSFRSDLVLSAGHARLRQAKAMYDLLPPSLQRQLDEVDLQLRPFGYRLLDMLEEGKPSALSPWEIRPTARCNP